MKYYRHKTCGRLSRINGVCEDCEWEAMTKAWPSAPLPCGHDNTGIPFNKSYMGICDLCEWEWRNKKFSRDEEAKKFIKRKIQLNRYANRQPKST